MAPIAAVIAGCGPAFYSGALDLARVERGEIYVDTLALPGGRFMMRAVAAVDAPQERVLNVYDDVEGYPLWNTTMTAIRVARRQGDTAHTEFVPRPILWVTFPPVPTVVRVDRERREVSFTLLENEFFREGQWVTKVEPLAGERALLTAYAHAEVKPWWAKLFVHSQEHAIAESVLNFRRAVAMPRYERAPERPAPASPRSRVVVPSFRAEGVPSETARTLTRVFAEQLMRSGEFTIITADEAAALLDYARKQQLAGCEGEVGCALDIGRALEADRIVHGSFGKIGDTFVVTASLLQLPDGLAERRVTEQAAGEGALLDGVRRAAEELARR